MLWCTDCFAKRLQVEEYKKSYEEINSVYINLSNEDQTYIKQETESCQEYEKKLSQLTTQVRQCVFSPQILFVG